MQKLLGGIVAACLAMVLAIPAFAANRGGTLVFARQTDCIYLDPVHTSQNADIWLSLNRSSKAPTASPPLPTGHHLR